MKTLQRIPALAFALLGVVFLAAVPAASAQSTWTLQIADGVVSVNGRVVDADRLPRSLDPQQQLRMQWTGSDTTVVAFGDKYYLIERNGLREASPREIEVYGLPSVTIAGGEFFMANPSMVNRQLVDQLSILVTELDQNDRRMPPAVRENAMRAAQTAAALPHLELQNYWYGLRADDQELFDDYMRERQLESEAFKLARSIALLPSGSERLKIEDELRSVLDMGFELKQKNRQREIEQLESRLDELRQSLDERASKRSQIIERRFRELVNPR